MSGTSETAVIEETVIKLLEFAATQLPIDVVDALKKMEADEDNPTAKANLSCIIEDFKLAKQTLAPMCQDTGIVIFYVNIGEDFPLVKGMEHLIREGTAKATKSVPLRPNTVNPIVGGNTGDNTGRYIPFINYDFVPDVNYLEITAFPKGGGSENMSALGMLKPGQGMKGIKQFVMETVIKAGGQPCNPVVVGVGIGGGADIAMKIAKKQLLRPIGHRHADPEIAKLEEDLLKAINMTGIGSMGMGGSLSTAIDVKIDYAHRHPASLPVGVSIQCWAARRSTARIYPDGRVEFLTHKEE